jgi:hypothetical protein
MGCRKLECCKHCAGPADKWLCPPCLRIYNTAKKREWRTAHRERARLSARISMRKWAAANPELHRAKVKQWQDRHPEAIKGRDAKRDERIREGSVTANEWLSRIAEFEGCCAYCLEPIVGDIHREHMQPLCKGGKHEIANIVPSCARCNFTKGQKTLLEFARQSTASQPVAIRVSA